MKNGLCVAVWAAVLMALSGSVVAWDYEWLFSSHEDFRQGTYINTQSINGYLELSSDLETLRYLWVANHAESSVSKIDTITNREVARYYTGPGNAGGGHSPSRTAVDSYGNVWVGNRGESKSVVKIAGHISYCVDRNGNGVIDTSYDANNDGIIQASEMLPWGEDECVLLWPTLSTAGDVGPRAVAVDLNGYIWVGLWNERRYVKLHPDTGEVLLSRSVSGRPYGAVIDGNGHLWSSDRGGNFISQIDTNTNTVLGNYPSRDSVTGLTRRDLYGIAMDPHERVWLGLGWGTPGRGLMQVDANNPTEQRWHDVGQRVRGVTIDFDGNIWFADSVEHRLYKMVPADDSFPTSLELGCYNGNIGTDPIGVVTDSQGYIWVISYGSNRATKIRPSDCSIVATVPTGSRPYTYSDATGSLLNQFIRIGTWTVTLSSSDLLYWNSISWDEWDNMEDNIIVEKRALEEGAFTQIQSGEDFSTLSGSLIIRVTLRRNSDGSSPKLDNLFVSATGPVVCIDDGEIAMSDRTVNFNYSSLPGKEYYLSNMLTDIAGLQCELDDILWSVSPSLQFSILGPDEGSNITIAPNDWTTDISDIVYVSTSCAIAACYDSSGSDVIPVIPGPIATFTGSAALSIQYEVAAVCGNGILEPGEDCDNGPLNSDTEPGACRTSCMNASCGDSVTDPMPPYNEQCDDGPLGSPYCHDNCTFATFCGDGSVQPSEQCDAGPDTVLDGPCVMDFDSDYKCIDAFCGDGYLWTVNCGADCEECDEGILNSDTRPSACREDCTAHFCGDFVWDLDEQCDLGPFGGDGCTADCRYTTDCGNGIVEGEEQCDDGFLNSDIIPDRCRTNCRLPYCGDGIMDSGEECDAGLNNGLGGCSLTCTVIEPPAECGNHEVNPELGEDCDDGPGGSDTCTPWCRWTMCGDGIVQSPNGLGGLEECDDGNTDQTDFCSNACTKICRQVTMTTYQDRPFEEIDLYSYVQSVWPPPERLLALSAYNPDPVNVDLSWGLNSVLVTPHPGFLGYDMVNITLSGFGQDATMCFNFTVIEPPVFGMEEPEQSRLLVAKGKLIAGHYERPLTGNMTSWGPYIITVKVWEKPR